MIAIGSDHGGYKLKEELKKHLIEKEIEFIDFGVFNEDRADFPDVAKLVCNSIQNKESQKGILVCTSGVGMNIAANKFKGIYAVNVYNEEIAKASRLHNNTNVITFGQSYISKENAIKYFDIWNETKFLKGRYQERIEKM